MEMTITTSKKVIETMESLSKIGLAVYFSDPIQVRKSPHTYAIKINSVLLNRSRELVITFQHLGKVNIDTDMVEKMEASIIQRLLLIQNNKK